MTVSTSNIATPVPRSTLKISVAMPVFNESKTLRDILRRVLAVRRVYEVIVVDDASQDETPEILADFREHPRVRVVRQEKNQGKEAALRRAGFHAPRVEIAPQYWRVGGAEELLVAVADGTVRAGALLRAQSEAARARIREALTVELEAYRRGDGFIVPMPAVLASATKITAEI